MNFRNHILNNISLVFILSFVFQLTKSHAQWDENGFGIYYPGKVGIGIDEPLFKLHIEDSLEGGIQQRLLFLNNKAATNTSWAGMSIMAGKNSTYSSFAQFSEEYTAIEGMADYCQLYNSGKGIALTSSATGNIRFMKNMDGINYTHMIINPDGNIGIGAEEPVSKLEIKDGDIFINDIDKGIIMKSPDGNCWRGTLDNSGSLEFTQIDCPDLEISNLANNTEPEAIMIFPNPANSTITVDLKQVSNNDLIYYLYNPNGRLMKSGLLKSDSEIVSIHSLQEGMYLLQINDTEGNILATKKILKSR